MGELIFLGTACGHPMRDRRSSSILLETGGERFLLDAGEPCAMSLKRLDVPFASIRTVFLSHGHSDHTAGLMMFIQGCWLEKRRAPLVIYLPAELIGPLRAWLEAAYLPEKLLGFPLDFRAWEPLPGPADGGAGMRVSVNPTTHLHGLRRIIDPAAFDRFLAYSLIFSWPEANGADSGKRFIYSADLGAPSDMDGIFAQPCDLLICELAHFEPETLFAYLRDKPVQRLCLTHLATALSARKKEVAALAAKMLPGLAMIQIVDDGDRVKF